MGRPGLFSQSQGRNLPWSHVFVLGPPGLAVNPTPCFPLGIFFSTIISYFNNKDNIRARSMDVFLFHLQAGLTLY